MATLVLSAAGAAIGSAIGGGVLGLSSAVIGRAIGATVGQVLDQSWLAPSGGVSEVGKIDRFRLNGASEGAHIPTVYGRVRVSGQIIWSSRFLETVTDEAVDTGGKGGGGSATVRNHSYSVSLAVGLCTGEIARVGRVWVDGIEVSPDDLTLRVYRGTETQLPDPKIEAVEGTGFAPAFRGIAYVVIEDLALGDYGNRVPQFSFEVVRSELAGTTEPSDLSAHIKAVSIIPGSGEYALATTPVYVSTQAGSTRAVNINSRSGLTDFSTSINEMVDELRELKAASLVVSWFGSDLRCNTCEIEPKVEQDVGDGDGMRWRVASRSRGTAERVKYLDGRAVYGGTPADASVIEAIQTLKSKGLEVNLYPFILMDPLDENGLTDPWTGASDQPSLPWRGRITLSVAPGRSGSPDQTSQADAEVLAFFGDAAPGDFTLVSDRVHYHGPQENSFRRFILHYAHLCVAAGGVDAICIGSEMRGLTQIRNATGAFPAVEALRALAADVRSIVGPETKIGYAADWSEYYGYHPQDGTGDVLFNLDPLWADANIDFIGIDNYMPLSDWRDGDQHADAHWGEIYNPHYLRANVTGGEGYDWYYGSPEGKAAQIRTPIKDTAHGEDWVFRYKDIVGWWSNQHHDRPGGLRSDTPTPWVPRSKPIWFTELGCPAVDKGTNAPNTFLDPKSSESMLPAHSSGRRDDFIQRQYLVAHARHWDQSENNPVSPVYNAPMVDTTKAFVWAWDARPFPFFPNHRELWSDGANYGRGHWINGRVSSRSLSSLIREICEDAGVSDVDVSDVWGVVRGFAPGNAATPREALQILLSAYAVSATERDGQLVFRSRTTKVEAEVSMDDLVAFSEVPGDIQFTRSSGAETVGRVRLNTVEAAGDYQLRASEVVFPDDNVATTTQFDLPILTTSSEALEIAERWLAEARSGQDRIRFALPPSRQDVSAGCVIRFLSKENSKLYQVEQVEDAGTRLIEAVRLDPEQFRPSQGELDEAAHQRAFSAPVPVQAVFLDLPLLMGDEVEHAPHVAFYANPWPGEVALYKSLGEDDFVLNLVSQRGASVGVTENDLPMARAGYIDRGPALRVRMLAGPLSSTTDLSLWGGGNAIAIGDGASDKWEVLQFRDATLVGPDTYEISHRLRGQIGTDALIPDTWPAGSTVVVLDNALKQVELGPSERDLARRWRAGPSSRPYSDPVFREQTRAFAGVGLRPYAPAHLRAASDGMGGHILSWIRRTRVDGDSWSSVEVPVGEESESYVLRIFAGTTLVREVALNSPAYAYSSALRSADGVAAPFDVEVAQVSARYGPGPFRRITVDV